MAQQRADGKFSNLGLRLKTAFIFLPPVLAAIYFGSPWFDLLIAAATGAMIWEWARLCRGGRFDLFGWFMEAGMVAALAALYFGSLRAAAAAVIAVAGAIVVTGLLRERRPSATLALGVVLTGLFCIAFLWLRNYPDDGRNLAIWLIGAVWLTDTGAYAAGKAIGGPRLAPRISPNKTWAGLAGGIMAALVWSAAWLGLTKGTGIWPSAAAGICIAVLAQTGDLSVSAVKRHFGVKDTSGLVPGHGGVLDRLDGMLLTGPATVIVMILANREVV